MADGTLSGITWPNVGEIDLGDLHVEGCPSVPFPIGLARIGGLGFQGDGGIIIVTAEAERVLVSFDRVMIYGGQHTHGPADAFFDIGTPELVQRDTAIAIPIDVNVNPRVVTPIRGNIVGKHGAPMQSVAVYRGDNKNILLTVRQSGAPYDLTGKKLVFTMARAAGGPALLTKRNLAAGGSDAQVLIASPTTGVAMILLTAADTAALAPQEYAFDVVVETTAGEEYTVVTGMLMVNPRVSAPIT